MFFTRETHYKKDLWGFENLTGLAPHPGCTIRQSDKCPTQLKKPFPLA